MTEEKWGPPKKTDKEMLIEALDSISTATHAFACFADHFKSYVEKAGLLDD